MKGLLPALCWLPALAQAQQSALNVRLKHELDSLYYVDQVYREALFGDNRQHLVDSIAAARHFPVAEAEQQLSQLMMRADFTDMQRMRGIIQRYGYPGKTLVGTPTNAAAFYVIQHSDEISRYLPLLKQAAEQGELPFRLYAMMLDRDLMQRGKLQIYGSQGRSYRDGVPFIWPIEDPAHVNERRKKAGFTVNMEDYARSMGINYHPLTLEQVRQMPGYQATQK